MTSKNPELAAIALHRQGKLPEAEAQYWKALVERSEDDNLLRGLGSVLSRQGKFDQAAACYRRLTGLDAADWRSHGNLGNALKHMGRPELAALSYGRAIDLQGGVASLHYSLGDALQQQGKLAEAALSLDKALHLQADFIDAFIALSAIEATLGHHDQARKILLEGISLNPCYSDTRAANPMAKVLLFFGLSDCGFVLGKGNRVKLEGGHFPTANLLAPEKFLKNNFHISRKNLISQTAALPPHDLIVNTIACPDRERRSLETLSLYLQGNRHAPLINAPERILQTTRDSNYARLHDRPGITFPKTVRLSRGDADILIRDSGLSFPLIMRRVGTQSALSTGKLQGPHEIAAYLEATEGDEFYAIEFIDCRFREKYYRKLRLFCIGGRLYPVVCHIDTVWNVHGNNRKTLMQQNAWMQAEEKRFLTDFTSYIGPENRRRLESLHGLIGLDFYGIDFTLMGDNSILIFELNAAMRHSFDHARALPYLRPSLSEISNAFEAMAISKIASQ